MKTDLTLAVMPVHLPSGRCQLLSVARVVSVRHSLQRHDNPYFCRLCARASKTCPNGGWAAHHAVGRTGVNWFG